MSYIKKQIYTINYFKEWNSFIEKSRNGTFLNSKKFLNYHPKGKFIDSSLLFYKKNNLIAVVPAAIISENKKKNFFSHPGSTYGGIIINNAARIADINEIVKLIILHCKKNDLNEIIIKPPPKIYHKYPSDEIDFLLFKNGFKIKKRDLSTCIQLDKVDRSLMIKNSIVAIKQGKKRGILIEESEDFKKFWEILKENLKKYRTEPTHTIEEIELLKTLFPQKIRLFIAKKDNNVIGGGVVFIKNELTIHTQYLASDYKYEKLRPLNVIIDHLMNYGKEKGFKFLNMGVSTENFGEIINWGLFRFKEGFGGRGILQEQYIFNFKKK